MVSKQVYINVLLLSFLTALSSAEEVGTIAESVVKANVTVKDVPAVPPPTKAPVVTEKPVEVVKNESSPELPVAQVPAAEVPVVAPRLAISITKEDANVGLKKTLSTGPDTLKITLGTKCAKDSDCSPVNNTVCGDGMCVCITGFIPSKSKLDACVKVPSGLGDACDEEAQCEKAVPDSECVRGICQCPSNYVHGTTRCWPKQMLGGNCNITAQCSDMDHSVCEQNVCSCSDPYIPSPINKCLQPAGQEYGAVCEEDIQCSHSYGDEARCSHNKCRCINNFHYNGSKCVVDKKLGDDCQADEECKVSENNDSRMCLRNYCTCATGYNSLPGEDICTASSAEELAVSLTWVVCIMVAKYYLA